MSQSKPYAFVICNEREEFLVGFRLPVSGVLYLTWSLEVCLATFYSARLLALDVIHRIDRPGCSVLPVYDQGDKWAVDFSIHSYTKRKNTHKGDTKQ